MSHSPLPQLLLCKLRCIGCKSPALHADHERLRCKACGAEYPVREGRFPDFLSEQELKELSDEITFWNSHFGDTIYHDESNESYERWTRLLNTSATDEVVELGCGSGALISCLKAALLVGLEPAITLMKATTGFWGIVGSFQNIPFLDDSFDVVYFKHSLHHVRDKGNAMAEATRITRPGGRIIAIEPNADHPQRRLISNPGSPFRRCPLCVKCIDPHETFIRASDLINIAQKLNLRFEQLIYSDSLYDRPSIRQRLHYLYRVLMAPFLPKRFLFSNYFLSFRKPYR